MIYASEIAMREATPKFVLQELFHFLKAHKIIRPGYTTLQKIVNEAITSERLRIKNCLQTQLTETHKQSLQELIKSNSTLIELSALKQDAKNF